MPRALASVLALALIMSQLPAAIATCTADAVESRLSALAMCTADLGPELSPAEERAGMCDAFDGVAFTFCVALCEARECDRRPDDDERCALVRRGFARVSGGLLAPCETSGAPSAAAAL